MRTGLSWVEGKAGEKGGRKGGERRGRDWTAGREARGRENELVPGALGRWGWGTGLAGPCSGRARVAGTRGEAGKLGTGNGLQVLPFAPVNGPPLHEGETVTTLIFRPVLQILQPEPV